MINIQNIYYMLAYAFKVLNKEDYSKFGTESFDNVLNLYSAILATGVNQLIKSGLARDYLVSEEITSHPKGRFNISDSIKQNTLMDKKLNCSNDEFSSNILLNQILKSTMLTLLKSNEVDKTHKSELKKAYPYFAHIDVIDLKTVAWNRITYYKNNMIYKMLINICYLTTKALLQNNQSGELSLIKHIYDKDFHRLFERFVLRYYEKHYPQYHPASPQINWNLDEEDIEFLPRMQTDIVLKTEAQQLIIDTKLYKNMMQEHHATFKQHSSNLYQIFAYVKNMDKHKTGNVSGMLLYALSQQGVKPDKLYHIDGNAFEVRTIDLNSDFSDISNQLNSIAEKYLST